MKISVPRDALAPALAALTRVVERRNTIPILSNIWIEATQDRMRLKATDLDIEIVTSLPSEIGAAGAITVPAHTLTDIVRKLPAGAALSLECPDKDKMVVRSGRSRFTLQALDAADFPDITAGEMPHRFSLPAKELASLIAQVDFAISTEETRYYLNGIHLHTLEVDGETRLRAVATDGHRLSRIERPAPEGSAGMPPVIVPRKTVAELARLAKDHDGEITLELSATKIRAIAGETTLTSKLIDGTFPDYQRVIPKGNDKVATLEREDFQRAIDRVSTISSERGRAVKLALAAGTLTLSVSNPDSGAATEELEPDYDGPEIDIGFNHRYLLDVIGVLGSDTVQMKLADSGSPAIFQKREGDDLLIVLMPMRV